MESHFAVVGFPHLRGVEFLAAADGHNIGHTGFYEAGGQNDGRTAAGAKRINPAAHVKGV